MFINQVNSYNYNCRKSCKTPFQANSKSVVKTIKKVAKVAGEVGKGMKNIAKDVQVLHIRVLKIFQIK